MRKITNTLPADIPRDAIASHITMENTCDKPLHMIVVKRIKQKFNYWNFINSSKKGDWVSEWTIWQKQNFAEASSFRKVNI